MAIRHRITKLEKRLKPAEGMTGGIEDMVTIPHGLTPAQQEAFMENYRRERNDRRNDQETDDKKRVWFTIVFVPTPTTDGQYGKTTNDLSGRAGAKV